MGGERRKNIPALREHSNWEVTEKTGFELRTCSRVNAIINIRINKGERGGRRRRVAIERRVVRAEEEAGEATREMTREGELNLHTLPIAHCQRVVLGLSCHRY